MADSVPAAETAIEGVRDIAGLRVVVGGQCVFVLDEFEESREITARRLLDNLQHVYNPDITTVSTLNK